MRLRNSRLGLAAAVAALGVAVQPLAAADVPTPAPSRLAYPKAPRAAQMDDYHGTKVADPFRPLEDADAPATRAWIDAENAVTRAWLDAIPERAAIRARLESLWNYERFSSPFVKGPRMFYTRHDGLKNQPVLYTADRDGAHPRVLLDPNGLAKDGTVALSGLSVSRDGARAAVGLAAAGSDWAEWRVVDVATGAETGDRLRWVKFSTPSFTGDGTALYYARYDAPPSGRELDAALKNQKVYFHRLGTPQESDTLVLAHDDASLLNRVRVSDDGRWLVVSISRGSSGKNKLWVRDLSRAGAGWIKVADDFSARWTWVDSDGTTAWLRTDRDAPRNRLVETDLAATPLVFRTSIPEGPDVLSAVHAAGSRFVAVTLHDASHRVRLYDRDGKPGPEVSLPRSAP